MDGLREAQSALELLLSESMAFWGFWVNVGAQIITHTILGVPYYIYSIMGPRTLF